MRAALTDVKISANEIAPSGMNRRLAEQIGGHTADNHPQPKMADLGEISVLFY